MVNAKDPGQRNIRISIEANTPTTDGSGQVQKSWAELFKRWGKVVPVNGEESFKGHQLQAGVTHLVYLPSDSGTRAITPENRIVLRGKTIEIMAAYDVDFERVEVVLQCKENL